MVFLRHFLEQDAGFICENLYPDLPIDEAVALIHEWNSGVHQGRNFEMFAILSGDEIVGYASLLEHSHSTVSAGIELLRTEQNKGFGAQTLATLIDLAASKGYRIIVDQVRADNLASIKLHDKMGFESDKYIYRNQKNKEIILYIKPL